MDFNNVISDNYGNSRLCVGNYNKQRKVVHIEMEAFQYPADVLEALPSQYDCDVILTIHSRMNRKNFTGNGKDE